MLGQLIPDVLGEWARRAACWDAPQDWFFPPHGRSALRAYRRARQVCERCPVLVECREYALRVRPEYGLWGGLTPHEREKMSTMSGKLPGGVEAGGRRSPSRPSGADPSDCGLRPPPRKDL
jgi:WhiB family redox-sensing transcriptional regulator